MHFHHITHLLSALLTPALALLTIYIACQQYRLNKQSVKFQKFDQRAKVYDAIKSFIRKMLQTGVVESSDFDEFRSETKLSDFLFGKDGEIPKLIQDVYERATEFDGINQRLKSTLSKEQETECRDQREHLKKDLSQLIERNKTIFSKYLVIT